MTLQAQWTAHGQVQEVRNINTKSGEHFKTVVKIASLGVVVEAELPKDLPRPALGSIVEASGHIISGWQGGVEMVIAAIKATPEQKPAAK